MIEETLDEKITRKIDQYGVNPVLVREILKRESGFAPGVCNADIGCGGGQGLFQVIPSTERHCEVLLERELDMFKVEDNLDCGLTLLKNDGIRHWDDMSWTRGEPKKWGSGPYDLKVLGPVLLSEAK